jgi:hypothetical protein
MQIYWTMVGLKSVDEILVDMCHRLFAASGRAFRLPNLGEAILPVTSLLRRADIMQA